MLRTGQPRQAASVVGLLSRLDVPTLLELLPTRLPEWNRFYHDVVVRQIAYGAAHDRGRSLLELLEILDPLVLPQAIDEIGMSGDRTAVPPLVVMAEAGEAQGRSPLLQLKAVESLGRLRENDAVPVLRNLLEAKKMWRWTPSPRIAHCRGPGAGQDRSALRQPGDVGKRAGARRAGHCPAGFGAGVSLGTAAALRAHRVAPKTLHATISSSWGKSSILIRELSLGGGMGTKEDNLRVGSEANIDIAAGVRHIRGQVLLRRARVNEVGFEIVNTDLESRYRLRRILMDSLEHSPGTKEGDGTAQRKAAIDVVLDLSFKTKTSPLLSHSARMDGPFEFPENSLLHLGEDDHQRVQRQGLDQGQTENQRQLNAGAGSGIAAQAFGRSSSGSGPAPVPHTAEAIAMENPAVMATQLTAPAASPPCANTGTARSIKASAMNR